MTTTATPRSTRAATPSTLPYWLGSIAIAALIGLMQQLDGDSEHLTAVKLANEASAQRLAEVQAKREWLARRDICHRAFDPQTVPTELPDGTYSCMDARGRTASSSTQLAALSTAAATR